MKTYVQKTWNRAKLKLEENSSSNAPRSKAKYSLKESFKMQLIRSKVKVIKQLTLFNAFNSCLKDKYAKSANMK